MQRRLRVSFVSMHTSPAAEPGSGDAGGMNVVVREQAQALAAAGHRVDVFTRRSGAGPDRVELAEGVTLRFLDAGPAEPIDKGAHEDHVEEFAARLLDHAGGDVVHSHHWFSGVAALPVARRLGIPHVQSYHSIAADPATPLSHGERPESPGRLAGERLLARSSDAIVAISRAEARTVVDRLGGPADRVELVPPGVDSRLFRPSRLPPEERRHLLAAGRLHPLKGIDLAIEALALLPRPSRPRLLVAGEPSADLRAYAAELRDLAARRGVADEVHFLGAQHRVEFADLLRTARVMLVPSHSETYGLVALEAAASAVPVVASASGGLREAVVDGVTGLLVESRDPHDWAAAIDRLLSDTVLATELSRAARTRAEGMTWRGSAAVLAEAYRRIVDAH